MSTNIMVQKALVERALPIDGYEFHIMPYANAVMLPLTPPAYQNYSPGEAVMRQAAFSMDKPSVQALFDAMWNAGIRPTNANEGSSNLELLLAAYKDHIADLRAVAQISRPADRPSLAGSF